MMVKLLFLITILPVLTLGADYGLIKCEGSTLPLEFGVKECPNGRPCNINVGQTITVHGKIQVDRPVASATFFVDIIKADGQVVNILTGDACSIIVDATCPVGIGPLSYSVPVEVKDVTPGEKVTVKLYSRDENDKVIACVSLQSVFH